MAHNNAINKNVNELHGMVSRTDNTLSFVDGTRKFTIAPTGSSFDFWYQGTKFSKASTEVTITTTTGVHYLYFDSAGTLTDSTSAWDLRTTVPVATVFWNGSSGALIEERHDSTRNLDWHIWAHKSVGCRYGSGLAFTQAGSGGTATFSVATGTIYDEDIQFDIGSPQTSCRLWHQNGASTYTFITTASTKPFIWNGGTSRVQYPNSASSYALTDLAANKYVNVWVYAVPDRSYPVYIFAETFSGASGGHANVATARAVNPPDLSGYAMTPELKLLYRAIYSGDGVWQEQTDYRNSASLPAGGTTTPTAVSVTFSPAGNIAATNVQSAIEEVDTEKAPIASPSFTGNAVVAGTVTTGAAAGTTGAVILNGTTSGTVTLSVADAAGTWTMKLPTSAGSSGQYLQTDGSGNTTWAAASGGGGLTAWSIVTADPTAVAGGRYMANTTSGAFTITLPASPAANDRVIISDYAGTFATNKLTIGRNGNKIMGATNDVDITDNNATVTLDYIDATQGWRFVS